MASAGQARRVIYNNVYARTEKEKVKSRYEKIILSEKPFLLYKTALKVCCACAIIGVAEQERNGKGASEKSPHKSDARTQAKRAGGVYLEK